VSEFTRLGKKGKFSAADVIAGEIINHVEINIIMKVVNLIFNPIPLTVSACVNYLGAVTHISAKVQYCLAYYNSSQRMQ